MAYDETGRYYAEAEVKGKGPRQIREKLDGKAAEKAQNDK